MTRHLFTPITLRETKLRNRIGVSPMCQYSSVDGFVNSWHLVHLGARACGGAGLVFTEAVAVVPQGRITPHDAGIWSDDHVEPLRQIVDFIHSQNSVAGIQLAHAGRKASTAPPWDKSKSLGYPDGGWEPVAPSPIPFDTDSQTPRQLFVEEIEDIQRSFRDAAARAHKAGFKLLELHAAHGYLAHSFYSPLSNQRDDRYGGSFENRIRFVVETVREIRKEWPEKKPLSVRISCSDWVEDGWTIEESIELATKLKWEGVDIIDCSSGGLVPNVDYPAGASWQVPFAASIRLKAGVSTAAVGLIVEPMQADAIIRNHRVDLILIGREILRNPHWPFHAAKVLRKEHLLQMPQQYQWAIGKRS